MFFLIDGYNLLFHQTEGNPSLLLKREELISSLALLFAQKKIKGLLVFDGAHERGEESGLSYRGSLEIAYAPKGQSADQFLLEKIERFKNPKEVILVTNDKGLQREGKEKKANVQSCKAFLCFLQKQTPSEEKKPTKDSQAAIDRLEKIFNRDHP